MLFTRAISTFQARDVRFYDRREAGMIQFFPRGRDRPIDDDDDDATSKHHDDGDGPRPSKRIKFSPAWEEDQRMFVWMDVKNLAQQSPQYWLETMQALIKEAPNLETFVLHSVPNQHCYPVSALTALLQGLPLLKKLDVRCLNLCGTTKEFADLQHVLQEGCSSLEEFYYYGSDIEDDDDDAGVTGEEQVQFFDCLLSTSTKSLKRFHVSGISLARMNQATIHNIEIANIMENLEHLQLQVQYDGEVLTALGHAVRSFHKLVHFGLKITPPPKNNYHHQSSKSFVEKDLENSIKFLTDALFENSIKFLTDALSAHRFFVLELQIHSSLAASSSSSPSSSLLLQSWVDVLKHNYSCHKFSLTTFDDQNTSITTPEHQAAQAYVRLNTNRRNRHLSHFLPNFATPACWLETVEGLAAEPPAAHGGGGGGDHQLTSEDVLTGVYHFLHENVGYLAAAALTNPTRDDDPNSGNPFVVALDPNGHFDAARASAPPVEPLPPPPPPPAAATRPSAPIRRAVTASPVQQLIRDGNDDDEDPRFRSVSLAEASPSASAFARAGFHHDGDDIVALAEQQEQQATALPRLHDSDVVLGGRRGRGQTRRAAADGQRPTTATTCWENIVRGAHRHYPTLQDCKVAHRNLVSLATGFGVGNTIRFYLPINMAMQNKQWVRDWNDQKRSDDEGGNVYVRANDEGILHDMERRSNNNNNNNNNRGPPAGGAAQETTNDNAAEEDDEDDITASQYGRATKEGKYATCLIELAAKEKATSTLWSELARAKQAFADNGGGNGGGTDDEVDEYAGWVDVLARDYTDRPANMAMLTEVKQSLDDSLARAKLAIADRN